MNRDPLSIILSLIYSLNVLQDDKEYNINELKSLPKMDRHWITIKKYLKIIQIIQKFSPEIKLEDSKFEIKNSKIYERFNEKEKLILYLFNNEALREDQAIKLPDSLFNINIQEYSGYLFHKVEENKYYLSKAGMDLYKSINRDLTDLIYNNKDVNDFLPKEELIEEKSFLLKSSEDSADFEIPSSKESEMERISKFRLENILESDTTSEEIQSYN
ncbi:MAG: hypothetical protein BAJALOKI2v1_170056 [Promethearchaeota archaeon]|nr:MAG: hypothetical protein BAJALOKI2v1_170056 [Candidatus Lokiarchaeota archaeon]